MDIIKSMQELDDEENHLVLLYQKSKKSLEKERESIWEKWAKELAQKLVGKWKLALYPRNEFGFYLLELTNGNDTIRISYNNSTLDVAFNGTEVYSSTNKADVDTLASKINQFFAKNEANMKEIPLHATSQFWRRAKLLDETKHLDYSEAEEVFDFLCEGIKKQAQNIEESIDDLQSLTPKLKSDKAEQLEEIYLLLVRALKLIAKLG